MKPTTFLLLVLLTAACDDTPKVVDYSVLLPDAGGLKPGASVYIAGVQMGRVNQVGLEGEKARVQFDLRAAKGVTLTASSCVGVGFYGQSGDAHLAVYPGPVAGAPLSAGAEISCVKESALGKSAERAMANAEQLLSSALSGKGLISRLLRDEQLAHKIERFFDQAPQSAPVPSDAPPQDQATAAKPVLTAQPPPAPKPQPPPAPKPPKSTPSNELINPFK